MAGFVIVGSLLRHSSRAGSKAASVKRARQTGFTLGEVKQLFFGFRAGTPPSVRWQKLKKRKIVELDAMLEHIQSMRALLEQQGKCQRIPEQIHYEGAHEE